MTGDDVKIIGRKAVYDGYMRVDEYRLHHRRHDGGWTGEMTREMVERGHAVAVLPYDPALDAVVLLEQFRIGAFAAGVAPWQVEIVAGIIEAGEAKEDVARREALEECGCIIGELAPVHEFLTSPGVLSETVTVYCGRVDASTVGGIHGVADEHEDIRAFVLPHEEAQAWLAAGKIHFAPAIVALQWLSANRATLRARWR